MKTLKRNVSGLGRDRNFLFLVLLFFAFGTLKNAQAQSSPVYGTSGYTDCPIKFYMADDPKSPVVTGTNSEAMANSFDADMAALSGTPGFIDFESFPVGNFTTLPLNSVVIAELINTGNSVAVGNIEGIADHNSSSTGLGFNTTPGGNQHLQMYPLNDGPEGGVILDFFQPINAFGCYMSGREEVKRVVEARITYLDGRVQIVDTAAGPYPGGGLQFFGFITDCPVRRVAFIEPYNGEPAGERDIYTIDDIRYSTNDELPPIEPESDCIEFEDLTLGDVYAVGTSFNVSNTDGSLAFDVQMQDFLLPDGTTFTGGNATVSNGGMAGHIRNEMTVNNVNMHFVSKTGPHDGLSIYFGEYGGNINLTVNGDLRNFDNFMDLHGNVVGGVRVVVSSGGLGNDQGELCLLAKDKPITDFTIGGQELFIDHICAKDGGDPGDPNDPKEDCIEFEDLALSTVYGVGDGFGVTNIDGSLDFGVKAKEFQWADGTMTATGNAKVVNSGQAGHVGNEININNINLEFVSNVGPLGGVSIYFGEYGGNINLTVNGSAIQNVDNFIDLNGMVIGGVQVVVPRGGLGNDQGELCLLAKDNPITDFTIGGQELFIDHICAKDGGDPGDPNDPKEDCIEFEDLALSTVYGVGDGFGVTNTDGSLDFGVKAKEFQWADGTMTATGNAKVVNGGQAGHVGNEININNINLEFVSNVGPLGGVSIYFGEYGGNINLTVNGSAIQNVDNFIDLNGMVIGGVQVVVPRGGLGNDQGELCLLAKDNPITNFTIGGQELFIDHICAKDGGDPGDPQDENWDFGDHPDYETGTRPGDYVSAIPDYRTRLVEDGPRHKIREGLSFPADPGISSPDSVDAETDGQPTDQADGDDTNNADDETGIDLAVISQLFNDEDVETTGLVSLDMTFMIGIPVENTTGEDAVVYVFADKNLNGNFDDPDELVLREIVPGDGSETLLIKEIQKSIYYPFDACNGTGNHYLPLRLRISTKEDLTSTGSAPDGEVVDKLFPFSTATNDWCPRFAEGSISGYKHGGDIVINENLYGPFGLAFNTSGELLIANEGRGGGGIHVSQSSASGAVNTHALGFDGPSGVAYSPAGVLHISDDTNRVFQVAPDGTVTVLIDETNGLDNPNAIAFDSLGNLYVLSSGGFLTRFESTTLTPTVITGGYSNSQGLVIAETQDRIYISEENGKVYYITLSGASVSSSPGTLYADAGTHTEGGLIMDSTGNLFFSAYNDGNVLKIDPSGVVTTHATGISNARGLALDSTGVLYVTSYDTDKVYRIDPATGAPVLYAPTSAIPVVVPGGGLPGWTIYLDTNDNNVLDAGESSTVTDSTGYYKFTGLVAGTYNVREVMQPGWIQIFPGGPDFKHVIALPEDAVVLDVNFQNQPENPQIASCVDFEELTLGTVYRSGDTFVAHDAMSHAIFDVSVVPFVWSSGTPATGGFAEVENGGLAGHSGQELEINNTALSFRPTMGTIPHGVSILFGEYGGNLNLNVNGDFRNFDNFVDVHGQVIGGVTVKVAGGGLGNDIGELHLEGAINEFVLGGQEFYIDHICPLEPGDPQPGDKIIVGQPDDIRVLEGTPFTLAIQVAPQAPEHTISWSKNGQVIPDANQSILSIESARLEDMGEYQAVVVSESGAEFSELVVVIVDEQPNVDPTILKISGLVIDGYVSGGQVYFDANGNCVQDEGEPGTTTDAKGNFDLDIDTKKYDTNQNGQLDPEEGHLVVEGGVDIATGLPNRVKFTGPAGTSVLGPISTLVDTLINQNEGTSTAEALKKVSESLGLPEGVDPLNYDPFEALDNGDPNAGAVLQAAAIVQDTVVQLGALIAGASNKPLDEGAQDVNDSLAKLVGDGFPLDLTDSGTLQSVAESLDQDGVLPENEGAVDQALGLIQELNQKKKDAANSGDGVDVAESIAKIQHVGQGQISDLLEKLGSGETTPDEINEQDLGDLDDVIENAPIGDVLGKDTRSGTLSFNMVEHSVHEDGNSLLNLHVERHNGSHGDINVELQIIDGTASLASGDLVINKVSLSLLSGETTKVVDFSSIVKDDSIEEPGETFKVTLSKVSGSPEDLLIGDDNTVTVTIIDNDAATEPVRPAHLGISSESISISGTPGASYMIQASSNLNDWDDWKLVQIPNQGESSATISISGIQENHMFFRAHPVNP